MIKHWRLFDSITDTQISQLQSAGICVNIENDTSEIDFPIHGKVQIVKCQDVWISTANDKQETLLFLVFDPDKLQLAGKEYDDQHIWLDLGCATGYKNDLP